MKENKIDFIGDIHGHAEKLKLLLSKLGYENSGGSFRHLERTVVFIGDYIDRGPDNPGVVDIVRRMVDQGQAIALMGNHEYNAILFNMMGKKDFLRPHSIKNYKQHSETFLQYHGKQGVYNDMINWFKTLPLFLETDKFRAMHAWWHPTAISYLKKNTKDGVLNDELFRTSADYSTKLFKSVEIVAKGLEVDLPIGTNFLDKDGTERSEIRIKWWENPEGKTYRQMSVIPDIKMEEKLFNNTMQYYKEDEVPVFFGHYWLNGVPKLLKNNVCCLDYSVAKNGHLVAYRWDGERELSGGKLVYV